MGDRKAPTPWDGSPKPDPPPAPPPKIPDGGYACGAGIGVPLSQRLRRLVIGFAGEATLTCRFRPGGRVRGAGIISPNHCVECNQAKHWHVVAEAIPDVELAESLRAARIEGGG